MTRRRFTQPPQKKMPEVEKAYPTNDTIARSLRARSTFGSIEEIEEKRFPWLKKRRQARRPQEDS